MNEDARPDDDQPEATGAVPHPAATQPVDLQHEVDGDADVELDPASDATPEDAVATQLRDALGELRAEADRIAELGTGQEQVEAAERFAEDAGRLDEQVGAAARAADADGNG